MVNNQLQKVKNSYKRALHFSILLVSSFLITSCARFIDPHPVLYPSILKNVASCKDTNIKTIAKVLADKELTRINAGDTGLIIGWKTFNHRPSYLHEGHISKKKGPVTEKAWGLGSIGKIFTTVLALSLVYKHQLSLDESIADYLPKDLIHKNPSLGFITVRKLITHRSGLPREPATWRLMLNYLTTFQHSAENPYKYITNDYAINFLSTISIPKEGASYEYSNYGIGLLAYVIKQKMKKPLSAIFKTYLFKPLHLKHTYLSYKSVPKHLLIYGHAGLGPTAMRPGQVVSPYNYSSFMTPSAGMYASIKDVFKILSVWLGDSHTYLDKAVRLLPNNDLGWRSVWLTSLASSGNEPQEIVFTKRGFGAGFYNTMHMILHKKIAVVVLRNFFATENHIGLNLTLALDKKLKYCSSQKF